ncbi:endonuclease/exonuclease/phosphatase family protein [Modestobacter sp. SYSU DS0511]
MDQFSAEEPTALAGDLNAPISSSQKAYDRVERPLADLGLVDAYRVARALHSSEQPTEATYFHHRRPDQPFQIDHVFVPADWAAVAKVELGGFDTWVGAGRSEHVPGTVEAS